MSSNCFKGQYVRIKKLMSSFFVQYGCGFSAPNSWRNFDASPTLRFERVPVLGRLYTRNSSRFPENVEHSDIVKGLLLSDESCKAIYCSHILGHLSLTDCKIALTNTFRVLRNDSVFRLVVPDLGFSVQN